jgi:hypothetical protein
LDLVKGTTPAATGNNAHDGTEARHWPAIATYWEEDEPAAPPFDEFIESSDFFAFFIFFDLCVVDLSIVDEFIGAVPTGEAVGRALSSPVLCMLVPAELPADCAIAPALNMRASIIADTLVIRIILIS